MKRKTPMTQRSCLNRVSEKQEIELARRRGLKYQLWREQDGKCAKCGRMITYKQSELSHKKPLARGGKTEAKNCEVLCSSFIVGCHPREHGLRNIYNEQPNWRGEDAK